MQPHAHRIAAVRRGFIQQLKPLVTTVYGTVSEHADDVTIAYKADVGVDSLSTMARESLEKDRALGRTTRGIHRDDISFVMNEKAIRRYGSQGQMKTYLVALHLALRQYIETHTGITPVVLMDDIFGKLDDRRVMSLVSLLSAGAGRQVFITDARHQRIVAICNSLDVPARVIEIRDAAISSVQDYGNSNQKVNFGATPHHDQEE